MDTSDRSNQPSPNRKTSFLKSHHRPSQPLQVVSRKRLPCQDPSLKWVAHERSSQSPTEHHSGKGYILTAPDLVPMAMMRSSGSKAKALGWLGKPCSTVCEGGEGYMGKTPWDFRFHLAPKGLSTSQHGERQRTRIPGPSEVGTASGVPSTVGVDADAPYLLLCSL